MSDSLNWNYDYSNYTYDDDDDVFIIVDCIRENTDVITGACFMVIFCLSAFGNGMLFYTLWRFEDLRRVTMLFLMFLGIFDLLFTLTLPFWAVEHLYHWVFGDAACQIITGMYFVGIYGSLMLLTAMTVDRFFAIVIRSARFTRRIRQTCAKAAFAISLIISIAGSLRDAVFSQVSVNGSISVCEAIPEQDDKQGYYAQPVLLFFIPLIIIILCYGKILHTLMMTSGRWKYRTILVVLAIVVAFIVCLGPYHVLMIIRAEYKPKDCWVDIQLNRLFIACQILAYFHCCANPLLFLLRARSRKIIFSFLICSPEVRNSANQEGLSDPSHFNVPHRGSTAYQHHETELKLV